MTSNEQFAKALTTISYTLGNALTASASNEHPYTTMVGIIDQLRASIDGMAAQLAHEPAQAPAGQTLWCSQCVGDAMQAQQAGQPNTPVRPAVTILAGQAICNVPPHSIVTMTPAAAAAAARGEQVTPAGLVIATGSVPKVGS